MGERVIEFFIQQEKFSSDILNTKSSYFQLTSLSLNKNNKTEINTQNFTNINEINTDWNHWSTESLRNFEFIRNLQLNEYLEFFNLLKEEISTSFLFYVRTLQNFNEMTNQTHLSSLPSFLPLSLLQSLPLYMFVFIL